MSSEEGRCRKARTFSDGSSEEATGNHWIHAHCATPNKPVKYMQRSSGSATNGKLIVTDYGLVRAITVTPGCHLKANTAPWHNR